MPKDDFYDNTIISRERIKLDRAVNADGNDGGGYSFVTLDRQELYGSAKKYILSMSF